MASSLTSTPFVPASSPDAAQWVLNGITDFGPRVSALLPAGMPAYVRILHPAWLEVHGTPRQVSWARVAEANGRTAHPLMQWPGITGIADINDWQHGQAKIYDEQPARGTLPPEVARPLAEILRGHTTTPERCLFGLWDGYGGTPKLPRDAEVGLSGRTLALYTATLDDAIESFEPPPWHQSANLWWPADQSWCVATDIDLLSTYVGGSTTLAEVLLASNELEVVPATEDDAIHLRADTINPYPEP